MRLVLASQSPRRRELLASLGVEFDTLSAEIDETPIVGEAPDDYVRRLAIEKAQAGLSLCSDKDAWVLGSDTAVVVDQKILGKPIGKADFDAMMRLLSGRRHQVMTSVALVGHGQTFVDVIKTDVSFIQLSQLQIDRYWETQEPFDKAGGYGIQGFASVFVERISGSYTAVVGLPLHETAKILGKAGLPIWQGELFL